MKPLPPYETLPAHFSEQGFSFHLVARQGMVAVYDRLRIRDQPNTLHFEVIIIQKRAAETIKSRQGKLYDYPAREVYPTPSEWGWHGWTCTTRERAMAKFRDLCDNSAHDEERVR